MVYNQLSVMFKVLEHFVIHSQVIVLTLCILFRFVACAKVSELRQIMLQSIDLSS